LWPTGWQGAFEWPAALIGAGAFAALIVARLGVIPVIGGCALAGLGYQLLING
jgi:chromate transporter